MSGDLDFSPLGTNLFGEPIQTAYDGLGGEFTLPPFTVLNAAGGDWQARKRGWLSYGIESELGRDAASIHTNDWCEATGTTGAPKGHTGTSVFDPVLCELCYRWFCPPGGVIVDPFAGGSVRGVVAGKLGYAYHGIELRAEQVAENRRQAVELAPQAPPTYYTGDAYTMLDHIDADADLVFTCPPYFDLEVYSDDPADLSTQDWPTFLENYRQIIAGCVGVMSDDSFAVFVVGDMRDKRGNFRNFPGETIRAFVDAGANLYNESILVTAGATLALRTGQQFRVSRKMGKNHQNVLVFVKGDGRRAANKIKAAS